MCRTRWQRQAKPRLRRRNLRLKTIEHQYELEASEMNLNDEANSIKTRDEFVVFVESLRRNLVASPTEWENTQLGDFLEALAAWTSDMDDYYKTINSRFRLCQLGQHLHKCYSPQNTMSSSIRCVAQTPQVLEQNDASKTQHT
jgi:hypothetical protein